MKAALVTLSIKLPKLFEESHVFRRLYAEKYHLDFVPIEQERYRVRPNLLRKRRVGLHFEKFQIEDLLNVYDRIVYMDADTLIHPDCPNLLEVVDPEKLGCRIETGTRDMWKRDHEMKILQNRLGSLPQEDPPYFNAGILVLSRCHQPLFQLDSKSVVSGRWPEQTLLNYRCLRNGVPIQKLEPTYNFLPWSDGWSNPDRRRSSMIVHYAGPEAKQELMEDSEYFFSKWGL